jgi:preprotein translocase subunit SecG
MQAMAVSWVHFAFFNFIIYICHLILVAVLLMLSSATFSCISLNNNLAFQVSQQQNYVDFMIRLTRLVCTIFIIISFPHHYSLSILSTQVEVRAAATTVSPVMPATEHLGCIHRPNHPQNCLPSSQLLLPLPPTLYVYIFVMV